MLCSVRYINNRSKRTMRTTPLPRRRLAAAVAAALTVTVVGAALFTYGRSSAASAPAAPQATPVMVASVVESEVSTWDEFSGRLEAGGRVDVRSRVARPAPPVPFPAG